MPSLLATTCEIDTFPFRATLAAAAAVAPRKSPKPVLRNVRLDVSPDPDAGSFLTATDLEVGLKIRLVGARASAPFSALIDPNRLLPILARTGALTVELEADGDRLTVRSTGYTFTLNLEDPATYPAFPDAPKGDGYHELTAADLRRLVRLTRYATDPASDRYALGGCLVESADGGRFRMVGTDGRRLAVATCPAESVSGGGLPADARPVIPLKALAALERNLEDEDPPVRLRFDRNAAYATTDRLTVYTRLLEGRYPQYEQVIPGHHTASVPVDSGTLLDRCMLAAVTTSEESKGVDFTLAGGLLMMRAAAADVGASEVGMPLDYDGPELTWTLSPSYLADALNALGPGVTLDLKVIDGKNPVVLSDAVFTLALMPITKV